ncbi:uncharacterized protein LOC105389845 [Plutella xylostella]|uniref:uncharacterized protein LOC105389845 n=1 Tax=Plutella xylostella TaxID=51655 RepID=UPI002032C0C2|nr:uncharacterized protein LOC105389845 [Plutella xylostella]
MASTSYFVRQCPRLAGRLASGTLLNHYPHPRVCCPVPRHQPPTPSTSWTDTINSFLNFRQLEKPAKKPTLEGTFSSKLLNSISRTFFFRKNDDKTDDQRKRVPKLILVQNPFKWLMLKIDFNVLRRLWDPTFVETDFKFGTKQAISRVTHLISDGEFKSLNGLLTKPAKFSLMRELDRHYSERQRALLALDHDDIQVTAPRKIYFIKVADKRYCDVDMAFLALKWVPIQSVEALVFTEIFARFHRDYTPHCIPEWTIAYFKITRFQVLRRRPIM